MHVIKTWMALVMAAALAVSASAQKSPEVALRAAMETETVKGDLKGAIEQYKKVAQSGNRVLAAQALVRMAECYRKLGDSESRKVYEQIVRDYADQKEAVAIARARMGGDSGAAGMVNRPVWSGPKVDTYGTVSPDGRSISHVNWSTGALAIYDIATGADRDLIPVTSKEDNAEESVISKDGRMVAYSWFNHETNRYELRLANLTGDPNPRRLYDNPDLDWIGPYDWSPDSKTIVAEVKRQDRTAQIALISAADGSIRALKSIDWSGTGRIFFSPDGRFIGYDLPTADNIRQHDVLVLGVDGSQETVAVRHPSLNFMMGWYGKWLLFASDRMGAMGLWAIAMADGKPQGAAELIRRDMGWPESLGITHSGALYYSLATLGGEGSHIQTAAMDFETGKLLVPPTDVTHPHGESDSQPFWSHDAKLMAYLAERGRLGSSNAQNNGMHMRDNALAIRAADTGQLIRELPLQLERRIIGWTADDRAVWLAGTNSKGKQGLFRLDIQSGEMTTVASAILDFRTANGPISPDGPTAFYRRALGEQEVVFMSDNIASGEEKEIARGEALGAVNLSPDSKWICTTGVDRASNSRVLLLIPAAGGMPQTLMATPSAVPETELTNPRRGASLNFAAWGPGMQWVLAIRHAADSSQADELWRVSLDGGAARKIEVERGARIPFNAGPSLAPDGTHLAFTITETTTAHTSEIWALENFLPRGGSK